MMNQTCHNDAHRGGPPGPDGSSSLSQPTALGCTSVSQRPIQATRQRVLAPPAASYTGDYFLTSSPSTDVAPWRLTYLWAVWYNNAALPRGGLSGMVVTQLSTGQKSTRSEDDKRGSALNIPGGKAMAVGHGRTSAEVSPFWVRRNH
jgi:hypothetical protein